MENSKSTKKASRTAIQRKDALLGEAAKSLDIVSYRRAVTAASYASTLAWRLIPCSPRGKRPLIRGWTQAASNDPVQILRWALEFHGCNWGVATGEGSGVLVLDIDGAEGRRSLHLLQARHGALPATFNSRSGRAGGGQHLWFRYPAGKDIPCSVGKLGKGLDVRANSGQVIVPASVHESGRRYEWGRPLNPIAEIPGWLVHLLTSGITSSNSERNFDELRPRFDVLVEGERNDGLFRRACALRRRGAEFAEIEAILQPTNLRRCQPPLPEAEVRRIARSAAGYPIGGPDPLEQAWADIRDDSTMSHEEQFRIGCANLQRARPGLPIGLPTRKIGKLMGLDRTMIGKYRKNAVNEGRLVLVSKAVPKSVAAKYFWCDPY